MSDIVSTDKINKRIQRKFDISFWFSSFIYVSQYAHNLTMHDQSNIKNKNYKVNYRLYSKFFNLTFVLTTSWELANFRRIGLKKIFKVFSNWASVSARASRSSTFSSNSEKNASFTLDKVINEFWSNIQIKTYFFFSHFS